MPKISLLKFEDMILPPPGADQVRVRVRAASVNFPDILMAQGKYQHRPELPFIVGGEMAGEVIAVGADVTRFKIGDRVVGGGFSGAFAEETQAPQPRCAPFPTARISRPPSFTTAYLTAYVALVRRGELREGRMAARPWRGGRRGARRRRSRPRLRRACHRDRIER
jgi:NADPH2:quinone reductase